jgi:TPR repeat protein
MYANGLGVGRDYMQAIVWYNKAAALGDVNAQSHLGGMYANGLGVRVDYAQAAAWYRQAAEKGDASAQFNLGSLYLHGQGVPEDYILAHFWFNLAASEPSDVQVRDPALKNRDFVRDMLTPDQIAETERLASGWNLR